MASTGFLVVKILLFHRSYESIAAGYENFHIVLPFNVGNVPAKARRRIIRPNKVSGP
jgi:hypothetical protein